MKNKKSNIKKSLLSTGRILIVLIWSVFVLLPIYAAVVGSLTPANKIGNKDLLPKYFEYENYIKLFKKMSFLTYYKNSLIYSFMSSFIVVVLAVLFAYALSRFHFKTKRAMLISLLMIQTIPQIVIIVPMFLLVTKLGLFDSYFGVVVAIVVSSVTFPILTLRSFFDTMPYELEEAAMIDGCGRLSLIVRIVLPLIAPGVMTAFGLAFFNSWAQYLYPMMLTSSTKMVPLTVGTARIIDITTPWELLMAGTVVSAIPAIIIYVIVERYLVQGLMVGSIK